MGKGVYNKEIADKAVRRLQNFKLYKGEWAGKRLKLLPWQEEPIRKIMGTVDPATGFRTIREVFCFIPARNGKTVLSAALCLYFLLDPTEPGGICLSAAPTQKQAADCYDNMVAMIQQEPELDHEQGGFLKYNQNLKTITNELNRSVYRAIAHDSKNIEGADASFILVDELHAHPADGQLFKTLQSRMSSRRQPLIVTITTAGNSPNPEHICYERYQYAKKVQQGILQNEKFLPVIFEAEEKDDPFDPKVWEKANPSLASGVKKLEGIETLAASAKDSPALLQSFRRYQLNQWVQTDNAWLDLNQWKDAADTFTLQDMKGKDVYLGIDLSSNTDLTSIQCMFPVEIDGEMGWRVWPMFFAPKDIMDHKENVDQVAYRTWTNQGYMRGSSGDATDYEALEEYILDIAETCKIKMISLDRWNAAQFGQNLQKKGLPVCYVRQNGWELSKAMKEVERLLLNKKLKHPNNPVMNWNVSNAMFEEGQRGDYRLVKEKGKNKIDGVVAMVTALAASLDQKVEANVDKVLITSGKMVWL